MDLVDIEKIGGITTKTITMEERLGNDLARILETASGLLNSIGLQNIGLKKFQGEVLEKWENIKNVKMIVSVGGNSVDEYVEICKELDKSKRIDAFELNISCPNVKKGCIAIGQNTNLLKSLIEKSKNVTNKPIIIKISPNFHNICEIAKNIEIFGADAICMFNTFIGTKIDITTKKFYFKNKIAGYSGPAIKPLALKMFIDIKNYVKNIPIIGMGGISNVEDALEFMIAGANLVGIGTMNFKNPRLCLDIIKDLEWYCENNNISEISSLINSL
ncbi:MAG: dihydroorotate dehydrogenase, partial [Elusimicrobiota bacterium]|jgi:dihydroorotate dehydrogenase (NAD+) catalytic subunit|nr:dihydroorotate dehydrogenase [Elusimicrobiota bacterium]